MNRLVRFGIVALALAPLGLIAQTLTPSQDAYYIPGNATTYGKATSVAVGASSSVGLEEFDLTGLPAGVTAGQVVKANLTFYANTVNTAGSININFASGSWVETTVSGTVGFPAQGALVASGVAVSAGDTFITVDVTSAVQSWISGSVPNNGFFITANGGTNVLFDSKETTTTSHPATLSVVLSYPGAQGPSGPSGPAGASGPTGASGPSGPSGPSGLTGPSGPSGPTGLTGPSGPSGPTGLTGPSGPSGPAGVTGPSGPSGPAGPSGPSGPAGVTGPSGPSGPAGPSGPSGPAGVTGPSGPSGPAGPSGPSGPAGVTGPSGPSGPAGPSGPSGPAGVGAAGPTGPSGPSGPSGPGGSSAVYGDGSDGAGSFGTANWVTSPPSSTLQFTTLSITGTLTVPSGTVIRATGNVTISGSIVVVTNPNAGQGIGSTLSPIDSTGGTVVPGSGAVNSLLARLLVNPGAIGGGIGLVSGGSGGVSASGGGTIVIAAAGSITIDSGASIHADGGTGTVNATTTGGGGGGGGVIVLASKTSITNSGTLSAVGGQGANSVSGSPTGTSGSGGGGGGVINLLAPSISAGTATVAGGAAGNNSNSSSGYAGGGGGSGGAGGSSGTSVAPTAGGTGLLLTKIMTDPSTLFVGAVHLY